MKSLWLVPAFALLLSPALPGSALGQEDGLEEFAEPLDENDLSEIKDENSTSQPQAKPEESAISDPPVAESQPVKLSKEDEIRGEYEAYVRKKEEEADEDRMRQRLFHENAKNNTNFDVSLNDLGKMVLGDRTELPTDTIGINIGYNHIPWRSRYFGRLGVGLNLGVIGLNKSGAHFRAAFFNVGPRISYELKFLTAQILVPIAYVGYDRIFNQLVQTSAPGRQAMPTAFNINDDFNTLIYGAGLMFNLNRLDAKTGTQALVTSGIRKFNLVALYQMRKGDIEQRSSNHISLGLRFEY